MIFFRILVAQFFLRCTIEVQERLASLSSDQILEAEEVTVVHTDADLLRQRQGLDPVSEERELVLGAADAVALEVLHHVAGAGHGHAALPRGSAGPDLEIVRGLGRDDELNVLTGGVKLTEHLFEIVTVHDDLTDNGSVGKIEVQALLRLLGSYLRVVNDAVLLKQQNEGVAVASIANFQAGTGAQALARADTAEHVETLEDNVQVDGEGEVVGPGLVPSPRLEMILGEYLRLYEGIRLNTLGVFHGHLDTISGYEPGGLLPANSVRSVRQCQLKLLFRII